MKSLTIGAKFRAGSIALFASTLILGMTSVLSLRSMNTIIERTGGVTARKLELSGRVESLISQMFLAQRGFVIATFMKERDRAEAQRRDFDAKTAAAKAALEEIRPLLVTAEGKQLYSTVTGDLQKWLDLYPEVIRLCEIGNPAKAQTLSFDRILPIYNELGAAIERWNDLNHGLLAADQKSSADEYARGLWIAIGLLILSALVGVGILLVTRQVNNQLRKMVSELGSGANQVASASSQIATTSQSLSQGASEQAASVQEVSASMEEMTAMARSSGTNSSEAMTMMLETAQQVERSNAALTEMVGSMNAIKSSSERVAKINKTIDEIAFQTNILALNAAVEAARAGEAGMGFAVVADEVRNLAQRAAAAAKDTAALIEESITNSNQGAQKLDLVSEAIRGITEGATRVKQLVTEVNEAGKQSVQGIQQVSTAIQQVNTVTQTTAASAEESAAAAEELNAQSMTVRELVGRLSVMVDGHQGHVEARAPRAPQKPAGAVKARPAVHHDVHPSAAPKAAQHEEDPFPMDHAESGSFRSF